MSKKYNDNSIYFRDWTDEKLQVYKSGYDEQLEMGQFSTKDSLNGIGVDLELQNRKLIN